MIPKLSKHYRQLPSSLPLTQQGFQLRKPWLFPCNILIHSWNLIRLTSDHQIINVLLLFLISFLCSMLDTRFRALSYHLGKRQLSLCLYHPSFQPTPKYLFLYWLYMYRFGLLSSHTVVASKFSLCHVCSIFAFFL